jgi:hypothetical protein
MFPRTTGPAPSGYPLVIKMHLNVGVFTGNNTRVEVLFPSKKNLFSWE